MGDCRADDDGTESAPIPDETPSAAAEAEAEPPHADVEPLAELRRRSAALWQSVDAHMKELGKQ